LSSNSSEANRLREGREKVVKVASLSVSEVSINDRENLSPLLPLVIYEPSVPHIYPEVWFTGFTECSYLSAKVV